MGFILFADTSDGITATLILIAGLIGGGITWLATYLSNRHDRQRKEEKEDEKTIVDHLKEVERRCTEENKELKQDNRHINRRMVRVINHLMYLEGILESRGITFRKFSLDEDDCEPGSQPHNPMPGPDSKKIPRPSKKKEGENKNEV